MLRTFLYGNHMELILGDCLDKIPNIPSNSIDLTVTSPPYDNLRSYGGIIDTWSFEKFQGIARELFRVTKLGGGSSMDSRRRNN